MRQNKPIITWLILAMLSVSVIAQEVTKVGITAAPFLKIGVGARSTAMGGAFVSVADDISAMYWNVAGIAQLQQPELIFNHSEWLAEINYDYLGAVFPMGTSGTFGVSMTALTMGEFEQTTETSPDGTGVLFSASDLAASVSFARMLTDKFMIGFSGKYIRQSIWNSTATGMSMDIGTLFTTPFRGIRLGMSINNFGTKMQMDGDDLNGVIDPAPSQSGNNGEIPVRYTTGEFDLPLVFRVGLSMEAFQNEQNRLTLAIDAKHPNDNAESLDLGLEYAFSEFFFLRAGYQSLFLEDATEGFTLGAGLNANVGGFRFLVDYAYQDFDILENAQFFTVRLAF